MKASTQSGTFAFAGHHVEELTAHVDPHAGVRGGSVRDLHVGHLQAELLDVPAAAQLDADDQLDRRERRHLLEEPAHGDFDQSLGVIGHTVNLPLWWADGPAAAAQIL